MNINAISNINCRPQQAAKNLGFGNRIEFHPVFDEKPKETEPSFEQQVLANQQTMLRDLYLIKDRLNIYEPEPGMR
jgi:hypothetical protein